MKKRHIDDIIAIPPEGFKKLEPINRPQIIEPKIKWGSDYNNWSMRRKIKYLEKLATSMNNAADILQKERNALQKILINKEEIIKELHRKFTEQTQLLNERLTIFNQEKQNLYARIEDLDQENGKLKRAIRELKNGNQYQQAN